MALQGWRQREDELQSQINGIKSLMIGAHPPGELPPYVPPDKPSSPWEPGKSPAPSRDKLMISHGEGRGPQPKYHDEYNQPLKLPPWVQMNEAGELIEIPWMKEEYLKEHPELASGPDYIGDKLRYGQLDRILNPLGDYRKPTLDQLRIHKNAYPKA